MIRPSGGIRHQISFRAINRRGDRDYDPGLQRHHLLPRQLLTRRCFATMFDHVGVDRIGFDDFRLNGLLLPASDPAAARLGLPLHRGPHRSYNSMVIERVGRIEAAWSAYRGADPEEAAEQAAMRLMLLQKALRRRLLDPPGEPFRLNRRDRLGQSHDFSMLDAMADALWGATEPEA